jgi:2-oxo-3-hexenedioate decarboxylase
MSDAITRLAGVLDDAATKASAISQLTELQDGSLTDAYAIGRELVRRRENRGERVSGIKLGFTSVAKMRQMGVHELIYGWLTDGMRIADGGAADLGRFIHPRIEPEVAFLLGAGLHADASEADVRAAVVGIAPAMEIIDSRYDGFHFSLPAVIADNASSAGYVIGPWREPAGLDLGNLGVLMDVDGRVAQTGSTAAILGHPARSLAAAVRLAAAAGVSLRPGWVVLAGAATAAIPLPAAAHVRTSVTGLGQVSLSTTGGPA